MHQQSQRQWQGVVDSIQKKGRPVDSAIDVLMIRPLTEVDKEMLRAIKSFTSENDPVEVLTIILRVVICIGQSVLSVDQSASLFDVSVYKSVHFSI